MGLQPIPNINISSTYHRKKLRSSLRSASRGNHSTFMFVADHYLNFITEYLQVSGYHDEQQIQRYTRELFLSAWQEISYFTRVSDFERQLFLNLKKIPVSVSPFQSVLTRKLIQLNATQRFLLVARDLEQWSSKNLVLSTRLDKSEVSDELLQVWTNLVPLKLNELNFETRNCIEKVVDCLEGFTENAERQRLCNRVKKNKIASAFKANCLLLRCDIVEFRQNARWTTKQTSSFFADLVEDLSQITPTKPLWFDRLRNQFHFESTHA